MSGRSSGRGHGLLGSQWGSEGRGSLPPQEEVSPASYPDPMQTRKLKVGEQSTRCPVSPPGRRSVQGPCWALPADDGAI